MRVWALKDGVWGGLVSGTDSVPSGLRIQNGTHRRVFSGGGPLKHRFCLAGSNEGGDLRERARRGA